MIFLSKSLVKIVFSLITTPLISFPTPSLAQVSIGYRNPIITSGSVARSYVESVVQTNEFLITGKNVIPSDNNSRRFNRSTIWIIKDQDKGLSLKVKDANPLIEDTSIFTETKTAAVSRTEVVNTVVSGPAAQALRSVFPSTQGIIESEFLTPDALGF